MWHEVALTGVVAICSGQPGFGPQVQRHWSNITSSHEGRLVKRDPRTAENSGLFCYVCRAENARNDPCGGPAAARCFQNNRRQAPALFVHPSSHRRNSYFGPSPLRAAATIPQNLTSGRRSSRPHQNSSYSRSLSSIGWNQSSWRHLAARTLCGPPAEFSRGLEFPRAKAGFCTLRAASGRLHRSSLWDFALGHTAPKRDQKLSGQRHYRDPTDTPAFVTHARAEPSGQGAVGLMPHPQPGQLDHDVA